MLARTLLEWCDKNNKEAMEAETASQAVAKVSVSGAVEAFVDYSVALGTFVVAIAGVGMLIGKLKK